jgi:hypothetical protein
MSGISDMLSIKNLKMKKVKDFFLSREAVREIRNSLEQKTEKDFRDFARSKQNVREQAYIKILD